MAYLRKRPRYGWKVRQHPFLTDLGFKSLNAVRRGVLRASGGHVGGSAYGMTVIELHTIGRRTEHEHSTILTAPLVESERLVLVASKGGGERDPDWYCNLLVQPDADFTVSGQRTAARARVATPEEAVELWPQEIAAYRPYGSYQHRSPRDIPLVLLERR
jgi:deazaflavin-dependent oxidoreductase (nitroreductase family)